MSEPSTVNCGLIVPNVGDLLNHWGDQALNPDFVAIDGYLGGVQTISVSTGAITLTSPVGFTPTPGGGPTQAQNAVIKLTGALTGSVSIGLPLPGVYTFHNLTTNAGFPVLILSTGGGPTEIGIPQGGVTRIYSDGTNVYYVDLPQVGSFLDLCTTTVPAWIANSSPAPWLYCNGATFSAVTYPYLNSLLGGATLPDLRGRSRFFFNDTTGRITSGGSGINGDALLSAGGNELLHTHSHAVIGTTGNDNPDHAHEINGGANLVVGSTTAGSGPSQPPVVSGATTISGVTSGALSRHQHGMNFQSQNTGSGASQNMPPATISGMCFIRAG